MFFSGFLVVFNVLLLWIYFFKGFSDGFITRRRWSLAFSERWSGGDGR